MQFASKERNLIHQADYKRVAAPKSSTIFEITSVTPKNIEYISDTLKRSGQSADTYQDCPIYYLTTLREGGWMIRADDSVIFAGMHPHDDDVVLLFPERSKDNELSLTQNVLALPFLGKRKISFARRNASEADRIQAVCKFPIREYIDPLMDWVYPIHILDTEKVARMHGSRFIKIRNKVRRAQSIVSEIRRVDGNASQILLDAFALWLERMRRLSGDSHEGAARYYASAVSLLQQSPRCLNGLYAISEHGQIVGATFWSATIQKVGNLYINICDPSIVGLSDLLLTEACKLAFLDGVIAMNLGGSEISTLNDFKEKYEPKLSLQVSSYRIA